MLDGGRRDAGWLSEHHAHRSNWATLVVCGQDKEKEGSVLQGCLTPEVVTRPPGHLGTT